MEASLDALASQVHAAALAELQECLRSLEAALRHVGPQQATSLACALLLVHAVAPRPVFANAASAVAALLAAVGAARALLALLRFASTPRRAWLAQRWLLSVSRASLWAANQIHHGRAQHAFRLLWHACKAAYCWGCRLLAVYYLWRGRASPFDLLRGAALARAGWARLAFVAAVGYVALHSPFCGCDLPSGRSCPVTAVPVHPHAQPLQLQPPPPPGVIAAEKKNYGTISNITYLSIYDGDTLFVSLPGLLGGDHGALAVFSSRIGLRIEGINAPERRGASCAHEKRLAAEAALRLERIMARSRSVRLLQAKRDKYFRLLGRLEVDGVDVGRLLLAEGLAVEYDGGRKTNPWCDDTPAMDKPLLL